MKNFIFIIIVFLVFSCQSKKRSGDTITEQNGFTEIKFIEVIHDFGILEAGEIVAFAFIFENTGDQVLKIKDVKMDCACIKSFFSTQPVEIGKKGSINIEFDTSGLYGKQYRNIEILANCTEPKHLAIFAEIKNEQIKINL